MASKTSKALAHAEGEWSEKVEALKEGLETFDENLRDTVREHPVACFVTALAAGYLVGRLVARS